MHSDDFKLITGSQLRAARALLRWNQDDLACNSRVASVTIVGAEVEDGPISVTAADARALRTALEKAGVAFIDEIGGGGVCALPSAAARRTRGSGLSNSAAI